jgi:PAS domain S-box-containing protein
MFRVPATLRFSVPLILLVSAAALGAFNFLYFVPRAEHAAQKLGREHVAQTMSRLQSTLEYLLLKGDVAVAQHEVAVLAHDHDMPLVALTDDKFKVIASTHRALLERPISSMVPKFDPTRATDAIRRRQANITFDAAENALFGYAGILMGREHGELIPSRSGSLFLMYDLNRSAGAARAQVVQQSLYWAGWVAALALAMWLAFHFLLTRRTARLAQAAERFAAGDLTARSSLRGRDELGRLSRAFDAMAADVAFTQRRLRRDIVERERVQQALAESEASYRAIFDATEDAVFVFDIDTAAVIDANPKACVMYGLEREALLQIDLDRLRFGESRLNHGGAREIIAGARGGETQHVEWHLRHPDGSLYWEEAFMKRVNLGGRDRVLALIRDITDRKVAEAALRASEEQYHAMFNASIDGLALWNAAGERVDANPALWRMYGYADYEIPASPTNGAAGPSYDPAFLRSVAAGLPLRLDVTAQRKDGSALEIELHGIPMQYQGEPHVLTIARDVTEKKRDAEELTRQRESLYQREKLAALGSLLAGVAHELNNPLSVVVARSILLEEQGGPASPAALKIRTAAERCARIVRTFLAMARQRQPEHGPVAINDVVHAALDIAGYAIRANDIDVTLDLSQEIPPISADADQLHQVLLNLIINAQQSLQDEAPPRSIRVSSRFDAAKEELRIAVADNGRGIPGPLRSRIFEPYFTTKPTGAGTGVGLAVSLGIVEAHGGTLTVDCPSGGGAMFTIVLPVGAVNTAGDEAAPPCMPKEISRKVLVVDDEADIRETLAEILTGARHQVAMASSGREALARLAAERYDVILADLRMPDLDGRALYEEIEVRWPEQAKCVAFVTGDTLGSALLEFVSASGRPVIEKPFLPSDVRRIVTEIAANAEA